MVINFPTLYIRPMFFPQLHPHGLTINKAACGEVKYLQLVSSFIWPIELQ